MINNINNIIINNNNINIINNNSSNNNSSPVKLTVKYFSVLLLLFFFFTTNDYRNKFKSKKNFAKKIAFSKRRVLDFSMFFVLDSKFSNIVTFMHTTNLCKLQDRPKRKNRSIFDPRGTPFHHIFNSDTLFPSPPLL